MEEQGALAQRGFGLFSLSSEKEALFTHRFEKRRR